MELVATDPDEGKALLALAILVRDLDKLGTLLKDTAISLLIKYVAQDPRRVPWDSTSIT